MATRVVLGFFLIWAKLSGAAPCELVTPISAKGWKDVSAGSVVFDQLTVEGGKETLEALGTEETLKLSLFPLSHNSAVKTDVWGAALWGGTGASKGFAQSYIGSFNFHAKRHKEGDVEIVETTPIVTSESAGAPRLSLSFKEENLVGIALTLPLYKVESLGERFFANRFSGRYEELCITSAKLVSP